MIFQNLQNMVFLTVIKKVCSVKIVNLTILCKQYFACSVQISVTYWWFFDRTNIFKSNERSFQKKESLLEIQRAKRKFSDSHPHNISELDNLLIQTRLTTSKTKRVIQYSKLGIGVAHTSPNGIRLKILGNKEVLGKS